MKFRITMIDRPGITDGILEAVDGVSLQAVEQRREIRELLRRWYLDGESLTVEIDTDAKTCTVVEVGK